METLIFTKEWLEQIRNRYERVPKVGRPRLYRIATDDRFGDVRSELEDWIKETSHPTRNRLIGKLRSPRSFMETYHELAVGAKLRQIGYRVEYEKPIVGLTPDWYVNPGQDSPAFFVEVFTANRPQAEKDRDGQINDLLSRLGQIPIGFALGIHLDREKFAQDPRQNKTIAKNVRRWLMDKDPPVGARLNLNNAIFEVILKSDSFQNVQYVCSGGSFWVNPEPLQKKIERKIDKYGELASGVSFPLVIALVADPLTGLDYEDFEKVLIQHIEYSVLWDESKGEPVELTPVVKREGLCFEKKELSAAIWAWRTESAGWQLKAIHNPVASNPLPINAFGIVAPSLEI